MLYLKHVDVLLQYFIYDVLVVVKDNLNSEALQNSTSNLPRDIPLFRLSETININDYMSLNSFTSLCNKDGFI